MRLKEVAHGHITNGKSDSGNVVIGEKRGEIVIPAAACE